ncbi:unnamed protein product [Ostreobium quekettii]|uniref:Uncharacterized protein n=1 Tax=Ostreobium quekettii TaxID=121088 RepID=A0A8S1J3V1_9CHLO|nr:unnamed protein product [Ostreobium quekettii]
MLMQPTAPKPNLFIQCATLEPLRVKYGSEATGIVCACISWTWARIKGWHLVPWGRVWNWLLDGCCAFDWSAHEWWLTLVPVSDRSPWTGDGLVDGMGIRRFLVCF